MLLRDKLKANNEKFPQCRTVWLEFTSGRSEGWCMTDEAATEIVTLLQQCEVIRIHNPAEDTSVVLWTKQVVRIQIGSLNKTPEQSFVHDWGDIREED